MSEDFIVFSDLHLHNWTYGASIENGWNSRLIAQHRSLIEMEEYADENDIEHFVFCGDLFHTHQTLHAQPLRVATSMLERWKYRGYEGIFLVGNHDMANRSGENHTLDFISGYGHTVIDDASGYTRYNRWGHMFRAMPYQHQEREGYFNQFLENAGVDEIVLAHQGVKNVSVGSKGFILKDEIFDVTNVPNHIFHMFVGHYHSFRHLTNKATIVGSLMQHTWTDAGEPRGFLHVKTNPKHIKHVPIKSAPTFHRIDMCGVPKFNEENISLTNKFIRISNLPEDASLSDLREQAFRLGALSVEFELPEIKTLDSRPVSSELFNMPELVQRFMKENDLDEELAKTGQDLMAGTYAYAAPQH